MKVLVQRSKKSNVKVDNKIIGQIDKGLVLLVGFTKDDNLETIKWMVNKIINLRIFDDENGVMNKSLLDIEGSVLSISQFTLYAECNKGNRPSYIKAADGKVAAVLYEIFNKELEKHCKVEIGQFGSEMEVSITNDGPITIMLKR